MKFQKKHILFIGLSLGLITILLAFGKYNNNTKPTIQQNSDTNFVKIETKAFLDEIISKKDYTISELENEISANSYDHSLLLNKSLRFKVFLEAQNYSVELYSKNCKSLANPIGIENVKIQSTYSKGIENSNYLYDIAKNKEPNLPKQYKAIIEKQTESISALLGFSKSECEQTLSTLNMRNKGIFNDDKLGNNIISFNYITNPVDELFDKHYQEFSSYNNAPNEDFFLTVQLPKSWNIKEKNNYTNASTVAVIEPYEKYLNGIITISFYKKFAPDGVNENEYTDNDITEVFYEDDEILETIIFSLNKELKETDKIKTTLYQIGGKTHILYITESEIPNGLAKSQKIKSLNTITFHNGKLVKMSFSGSISQNEFSSFPYYSKLFFKTLNSVKFRELKENTIYLTNEQSMKFLTASIDEKNYKFLLDTGASNIVINKTVLSDLIENGYLTRNDYTGKSMAQIADGSMVECENYKVAEIKIGINTIRNVVVSVINSEDSMLLFGMDGLNKLNVKRLNLKENEIILNRE
jgi:predicted aspartyl protease